MRFILEFFQQRGIEASEQEVLPGRSNLIARLPGRNTARCIVFEAHCDTASAVGMTIPPFEPALSHGRLYGRGSCDTKAGLTAMMHALVSLKQDGAIPPSEIRVVAAVDEEHSFAGVRRLCRDLQASAAVVAEPTRMRVAIASKGSVRLRITCRGKAAHSSKPHLGTNAIVHMAHIVETIEADQPNLARRSHPLVGSPTCNIGVIQGGVQANIVPDACQAEVDRRVIPGEEIDDVIAHYRCLVDRVKADHPDMQCSIEVLKEDLPLDTPPDCPVALIASAVLHDMRLDPEPVGVPYCSDSSKLSTAGIPAILLGPGSIDQAHAAVEYVECDEVELAFHFYKRLMMLFV